MNHLNQSIRGLLVTDVMRQVVEHIPRQMSLPAAARRLWRHGVTEAPVTDSWGRCVGVLCATDFVRLVAEGSVVVAGQARDRPRICTEWQIVRPQERQDANVLDCMELDPATVTSDACLTEVIQLMCDANLHSVAVIDDQHRPIGVVSCLDILAAAIQPKRSGQIDGLVPGYSDGRTRAAGGKPIKALARG